MLPATEQHNAQNQVSDERTLQTKQSGSQSRTTCTKTGTVQQYFGSMVANAILYIQVNYYSAVSLYCMHIILANTAVELMTSNIVLALICLLKHVTQTTILTEYLPIVLRTRS